MKKSFIQRTIREGIVDTRRYRYFADMREYTPMEGTVWKYETATFDILRVEIGRVDHLLDYSDWERVARVKYTNPKYGPIELTVVAPDDI